MTTHTFARHSVVEILLPGSFFERKTLCFFPGVSVFYFRWSLTFPKGEFDGNELVIEYLSQLSTLLSLTWTFFTMWVCTKVRGTHMVPWPKFRTFSYLSMFVV